MFSEVRASISSKLVEKSTSFHRVLEEVEARTKVDIRFTNRCYVFCGSWAQIEQVRKILEEIYAGSTNLLAEESDVGSTQVSSLKQSLSSLASSNHSTEEAATGQPLMPVSDTSPSQPLVDAENESTSLQNPQPLAEKINRMRTDDYHRNQPKSSTDSNMPPESESRQPQSETVTPREESTPREEVVPLSEPELMMDTDMWDYMAKMNGFELRQLNTKYNVQLQPSTTEELTQVKIIPGKGKAVTADMMEEACLQLGKLYQSLFSTVVVETCKVPPDLDDQTLCQSAKDEVTSMFHSVLTKQNEYDPRVFTFIGAEHKSKEARYTFMDLVGMHPTSSRPRGGDRRARGRSYYSSDYRGSARYDTPSFATDTDMTGATGYVSYEEHRSPPSTGYHGTHSTTTTYQEEKNAPFTAHQQPSTQMESHDTSSSSSSSEDDPEDSAPIPVSATQVEDTKVTREVVTNSPSEDNTYSQARPESPIVVHAPHVSRAASVGECDDTGSIDDGKQSALMSLPLIQQTGHSQSDLIDFGQKFEEDAISTSDGSKDKHDPIETGSNKTTLSGTNYNVSAFQDNATKQLFPPTSLMDENIPMKIKDEIANVLSTDGSVPKRTRRSVVVGTPRKGNDDPAVSSQSTEANEVDGNKKAQSSARNNQYDISFLDTDNTTSVDETSKSKVLQERSKPLDSPTKSTTSKYGKSGKVMPQQNPFDIKPEERRPATQNKPAPMNQLSKMVQSTHVSVHAMSRSAYGGLEGIRSNLDSTDHAVVDELCEGCLNRMKNRREMPCTHVFCQECCDVALSKDHICPKCSADWWKMTGHQPDGTLNIVIDKKESLPGYERVGTICVSFMFPSGQQGVRTHYNS